MTPTPAAVEAAEAVEALNRIDKNLPMYGAYETGSQSELDILTVRLFLSAHQSPTDAQNDAMSDHHAGAMQRALGLAPAPPVELEECDHKYGNMAPWPRTCFGCGITEDNATNGALDQILRKAHADLTKKKKPKAQSPERVNRDLLDVAKEARSIYAILIKNGKTEYNPNYILDCNNLIGDN